uniref:Uncharacterized protein n=1 Tax=Human herpesvirus 1 TaxID=10298 RepID=A0A2Z4H8V1_HHV1|nr:hypothetical protein [Human alphaherpesvirus 1]AWW10938.1 hypothetical protein [Human alphaherpesvirus 1]
MCVALYLRAKMRSMASRASLPMQSPRSTRESGYSVRLVVKVVDMASEENRKEPPYSERSISSTSCHLVMVQTDGRFGTQSQATVNLGVVSRFRVVGAVARALVVRSRA